VGQEVLWNRFALIAEQTLADPALCWEVTKEARLQLSGHAARLSRLFHAAREPSRHGPRARTRVHGCRRGSAIVAQTFLRALWATPNSILHTGFRPDPALVRLAPEAPKFGFGICSWIPDWLLAPADEGRPAR